jgi:dipeptidyl aminopeptidase/acylaminoacyl peptidase
MREVAWDGDALVFAVEDRGDTDLYRVPSDGSAQPAPIVAGHGMVTGFDARGGSVAWTATEQASFAEVYVVEAGVAGARKLTDLTAPFSAERTIVAAERFSATSKDGSEVDAWIVRPADFDPSKTYPVLLNVHGGPFTQYGNKFFDEFQVQAGAGYVVLFANPRGSSGRSESWGRSICGPVSEGPGWGSVDYDDLMAVVDTALERFPFCDARRLGVLGGSYGGYMTSWIVGHTDRFKAAVSERAVNNMLSEFGSSDYGHSFRWYVGAYAFEAPDAYLKLSPSTYAPNIVTPLLIMHSENDLRCNVEQAEHLFTILRVLKREVDFVRFPGESHELSRSGSPSHRVTRFEIILDWFRRHLQPDGA